jgi:predicted RNA polymerase sigma factor
LLFNEGYHGASAEFAVRTELCHEAMRLAARLLEHPFGNSVSIRPSPIVALNRTIAVGPRDGPEHGAQALRAIADSDRLANYPFYHAAFGESELQAGRHKIATGYFRAALELARNPMERQFFEQRIDACNRAASSGSSSLRVTDNRIKVFRSFVPTKLK